MYIISHEESRKAINIAYWMITTTFSPITEFPLQCFLFNLRNATKTKQPDANDIQRYCLDQIRLYKWFHFITATPDESHRVSNHGQLDSLRNTLPKLTTKKISTSRVSAFPWKESTGVYHSPRDNKTEIVPTFNQRLWLKINQLRET